MLTKMRERTKMGLDQYLTARKYVSTYREQDNELREKLIATLALTENHYSDEFGFSIEVPRHYWRKANQIHGWFVENIQGGEDDCKDYHFTVGDIIPLRDLCKQVLDNHELAEDLLPVNGGFFFGSYEYDEYYFEQIQDTYTALTNIIHTSELGDYLVYRASW
jgi:hypothetical protein